MDEKGIYIGRSTWPVDLALDIPSEELESIPATDIEAFFDGMQKFFEGAKGVEIIESKESYREAIGPAAPLLIPGTRIFIRFGDTFRDWYKKLLRTAALYVIVGNISPLSAFAGLSIDLAFAIFEKLSRLDEADANIVSTILDLSKTKGGHFPSTKEIAAAIGDAGVDLKARLSSLKGLGLIREGGGGWQVVF